MPKYIRFHKTRQKIEWTDAPDIRKKISSLIKKLHLDWLKINNIYCVRSVSANTRAIARIWGLGRLWQKVLKVQPSYIIEVISEKFDRLGEKDKNKVLLHEIVHIPKNFSGSLIPHIRRGKNSFSNKLKILVAQYLNNSKK